MHQPNFRSMKRLLAFRHVPFEGIGRIEPLLAARGMEFEYADLYRPGAVSPDIARYDGLIFMGGPMSANDPLPFLAQEVRLITGALYRGQPLLGICLGSQLIARALGARIRRNPVTEIGWFPVDFTPEASSDPVFAGLAAPETIFHWHSDTWDLPAGAKLLASSKACRNQAFRAASNVYGMQFHLEVTPEMIADWMVQDENCGDVCELTSPIEPEHNAERLGNLSDRIFGSWLDLL
jgi:GMP synthase (glutamine-hydrolysing)